MSGCARSLGVGKQPEAEVQNTDIEEQVRKLLAGEIRTDVAMRAKTTVDESAKGPVPVVAVNLLPARAADNGVVARQQELLTRLRQARAVRADTEHRSAETLKEERASYQKSYERLLAETDRMVKEAEANLAYGVRSLARLNMQMPEIRASAASDDEQATNLEALQATLTESSLSRSGLRAALDQYADWWLQRLYRLGAVILAVIILILILRKIGAAIVQGIASLYGKIHVVLRGVEPVWLSQVLWIVVLVASVALLIWAVVSLVRFINRRFFDTESKRGGIQQRLDASRAELVKRVFVTEDEVMTRYFWGRMFVMVMFAIRHKTST